MKQAYPITITKGKEFYVVHIPDFDMGTQGETIADAMEMARDVIGMVGCFNQDESRPIPMPSSLGSIKVGGNTMKTLVDVDFAEYRRKHDNKKVRKNLTIPSWLNEKAEAAELNFSAVLQEALSAKLV